MVAEALNRSVVLAVRHAADGPSPTTFTVVVSVLTSEIVCCCSEERTGMVLV